jgi:hypothetical protein
MEQDIWVNYQYQLLRYEHDLVTGEFANLGIVYFDAASGTLLWRFEDKKYGRLSHFFGEKVQGSAILAVLKQLKKDLQKIKNDGLRQFQSIEALTRAVMPPDDNGWSFSQAWQGRHFDHQLNFEELYARIIGQYQEENTKRQDDTFAWKSVYKKYFDRHKITAKLRPHQVKTDTDAFDFQHTCKNGAWHCFQSLSFALKHEGSIKDKIYRWNGIARELLTSEEPLKVYLLSIFPDDPHLAELIRTKLNITEKNVEVRVVSEQEAEQVALQVKEAMSGTVHGEN